MRDNIPSNATTITFKYGRSLEGKFYIWPTKGGKYQWEALGNCGEAKTEKLALDEARRYIMDDFDPLKET